MTTKLNNIFNSETWQQIEKVDAIAIEISDKVETIITKNPHLLKRVLSGDEDAAKIIGAMTKQNILHLIPVIK